MLITNIISLLYLCFSSFHLDKWCVHVNCIVIYCKINTWSTQPRIMRKNSEDIIYVKSNGNIFIDNH